MKRKTALLGMAILVGFVTMALPAVVLAVEGHEGGADAGFLKEFGLAIGAGLGLGLAAFGGGMGQGRTAAAALEGIARNPGAADKMFVPMIIGLALIESLVIYTFLVAIFLWLKIPG